MCSTSPLEASERISFIFGVLRNSATVRTVPYEDNFYLRTPFPVIEIAPNGQSHTFCVWFYVLATLARVASLLLFSGRV